MSIFNSLGDTVNKLSMPDGEGAEVMGERDEETKKLHNSHEDVKYIIGNVDNNTGITMYGARWVLELSMESG